MRHTLPVLVIVALFPVAAQAQAEATQTPAPYRQIVSTNPFGLLFDWVNGEYERKIGPATTLGVSASSLGGMEYWSAAMVARWYPQQAALDGFYLGARAGAYRFYTNEGYSTYRSRTMVVPGVGVDIGYNWLLGPKQNVSVGLGVGMTRLLGDHDDFGVPAVLPAVRLVNIGIAF